jgi:hypothetical protein
MGGAKDMLSMVHLPSAIEDQFEHIIDDSLVNAYFGDSNPRRGLIDIGRAEWLLREMWGSTLTDSAIGDALERFTDLYSDGVILTDKPEGAGDVVPR